MRLKNITIFCLGSYLLLGLFTACTKSGVKPSNQTGDSTVTVHVKGWQQVASLPSARAYSTAFTLNGNGYIASGISTMGDPHAPGYDDMYMYDATANKWIKKAGMPALDIVKGGRRYPFTLLINNTVYGGGGLSLNGITGSDVNVYDPVKDQWALVAKWNSWGGFDRSSGVALGNKGYIFSFAQAAQNVYRFDPVKKTVVQVGFSDYLPGIWSENLWYGTDGTNLLVCNNWPSKVDTVTYLLNRCPIIQNTADVPTQSSILVNGLYYKGNIYAVYGNVGNLYRFNLAKGISQHIISQDLGVTQGAFGFIAGGKLYVAGGNTGLFSASTDKVWMIDLDAYPQ